VAAMPENELIQKTHKMDNIILFTQQSP